MSEISYVYPVDHSTTSGQGLSLHDVLETQAERAPDAIAIAAPGRPPLTYGRLRFHVGYVVQTLNAMGLGRNDRVALVLPNGPEMAVAFIAIAAGATSAPLNPAYQANEFDFYLTDLNAKALIVQSEIDSPAKAVAQKCGIPVIELSPVLEAEAGIFTLTANKGSRPSREGFAEAEDVALVLHTSGTTSRPKMVPLTQRNIFASANHIGTTLELTEKDRCLNVMPLFHIHGLIGAALASLMAGGSVVCTSSFDAEGFLAWLGEFRPTWYTAVPTMHQAVLLCVQANRRILGRYPLRFIRSSSAALPPRVLKELEEVFQVPVIEAYGMTEASHQISSNPLPPRERRPGSVGISAGPEVAIMDEAGNLLPPGKAGEIVIRGTNVMASYANSPEANRESFTHGWFRTGDQGYLDADGYLFITGRLKEIINRGGEKISPREVDEVLMEHPAVSQAVTFAVPHLTLGEDVAAAVVQRAKMSVTEGEIQRFAAIRLAEFKIPRQVLIVKELPRSATGKVQRIGLAEKLGLTASDRAESDLDAEYVAPRTPREKKLVEMWSQVLGIKQVGVHDNFFHLGGDSIHAARVISRVRESMRVELSFLAFFENPTVAQMARSIETVSWETKELEAPPLQPIPRDRRVPLSYAQERMWFFDQLEPGNPTYNRPAFIRFTGALSVATLEQCLNEIRHRHEVLRTIFPAVDGQPIHVISGVEPITLPVLDLRHLSEVERETRARQLAIEEARRSFDLARGPLIRAKLLRLSDEEYILLLTTHHIVFDGWSMGVLLREISALYEAFSSGGASLLSELPIQYADFAHWQRQWFRGEVLESQLSYWRQQLDGSLPVLELPTDHQRPPVQTFRGARQSLMLSKALTDALKALSQREKATLFMTLLAAFYVLLHRYAGQDDIIVGTPVAGRTRLETEGLIGIFINTLALRTDLTGNPTFRELLARVRQMFLAGCAHQDLPFEKLVEELQPERDLSRNPIFQVMFQLKNIPEEAQGLPGLRLDKVEFDYGVSKVDLTLEIDNKAEGLFCSFEYNTDLFDAATVERLGGHFETLLKGIIANPERRLSDLPMLTEAERQQLLVEWNDTKRDYPQEKCIHELFEAQVEKIPEAVAVIFEDQQLTYRELNTRANQLAHHLQKLGVGLDVLVGICVEPSLEMVVGILGILKAGGAYVPLDPAYPQKQLAFMVTDAQMPVLLTQERLLARLPAHGAKVVRLDTDWEVVARESEQNPVRRTTPENLAYVIYTSGSTGNPKGVLGLHRGTINRFAWMWQAYPFEPEEVCCQKTSLNFVDSIWELFGPLLQGIPTFIVPDEVRKHTHRLIQTLAAHRVTRIVLVPSLLRVILDGDGGLQCQLSTLKIWISSGEPLPVELARRFRELLPHNVLLNLYGSSEVSADVTWFDAGLMNGDFKSIPVGRPIANTQIYLLDAHLQPVPIGVSGEVYVGGENLARGYHNRPDLTAEKFIPNPFSDKLGERLYKTGDLARYLPDGNLKFLGRTDNQVKLRGFRIELGEIEAVLSQHPAVKQVVIMAREDTPDDKRLVAYVVPKQESLPLVKDLRSFLKERLPEYRVPSAFVLLETFPLTPNGKIDRRALPKPDQTRPELEETFVAPQNALELQLTRIWEKILGIQPIGVQDNFFELGGHSLLAVRLIAQIEKLLGKNLPVVTLFQAPTVEQLASVLCQEKWPDSWSSLIPIQPGGSKLPFFWIHGDSSNAFLPRYLGPDQPLYGLEHQSQDGKPALYTRFETIAAHYLKEIRTVQPVGPYFLGGYSFGSIVAFEAAQQLRGQGEEVALLALLDPPSPSNGKSSSPVIPSPPNGLTSITLFGDTIRRHLRNLASLGPQEKLAYVLVRVKGKIRDRTARVSKILKKVLCKVYLAMGHPLPPSFRSFYVLDIYYRQALRNYVPQLYTGRVLLFKGEKRSYQPRLDWQKLIVGELEIHKVPSDHLDMTKEPHIQVWAKLLKACLHKAQLRKTSDRPVLS